MQDTLVDYILGKGGDMVGNTFVDPFGRTRVTVICENEHVWEPRVHNLVYRSSWCPYCYGNAKHTLEKMQAIATARGGQCLSETYNGLTKHLQWKCANDRHSPWWATPNNVKNHGSWCPACIVNIGEEIVRLTLEEAFPGYAFHRTRKVPGMDGAELDGYNPDLGLAFEYQGEQHTKRVDFFQRTDGDFESQLRRDTKKAALCAKLGIRLLVVSHKTKFSELREAVRTALEQDGRTIAPITSSHEELCNSIRAESRYADAQYARAKEIVEHKGGELLSLKYISYQDDLRIKCGQGHVFLASLEAISRVGSGPRFCPDCAGTKPITEEQCREDAEARGYTYHDRCRVHDSDFIRSRWQLSLTCPAGHSWQPTWDTFNAGKDCGTCAGITLARAAARRLAPSVVDERLISRGLALVNPPYQNNSTAHLWRCTAGHCFQASLAAIMARKNDAACTICEFNVHGTIFGLQLVPQTVYGSRIESPWLWQCTLCPMTGLQATKTQITCSNFLIHIKRGDVLLGRCKAHLCPNAPPQPVVVAAKVRKAPPKPSLKAANLGPWMAARGISLVSPAFTHAADAGMRWRCANGHVFMGSHVAISKRTVRPELTTACQVCSHNADGAHYGWQFESQAVYNTERESWPRMCLLCPAKGIIAAHNKMKSNNHGTDDKKGICLFGRSITHRCLLPRGCPQFAPFLWLIWGRRIGLSDVEVRYILWLMIRSCMW